MTDQRLIDAIRDALLESFGEVDNRGADRSHLAPFVAQRLESKVIWRDDVNAAMEENERIIRDLGDRLHDLPRTFEAEYQQVEAYERFRTKDGMNDYFIAFAEPVYRKVGLEETRTT